MKNIIILSLCATLLYLSLGSNSSGIADSPFPNLNRTGSDGGTPGCDGSGCHNNSLNSGLSVSINVYDNQGQLITNGRYQPNAIYTIKLHGFAQTGSYTKFGFQLSAAWPNDGNFVSPNTALIDVHVVGSNKVVEQAQPLNASSNSFDATIYWQTPSTGDSVTLFLTMLGANDNGFATGDIVNFTQSTFKKNNPNSVASLDDKAIITPYPNPAKETVFLKFDAAQKGNYQLAVYNMNGQNIFKNEVDITASKADYRINSSGWSKGMYILHIAKDGAAKTWVIVKE